MELNPRETTRFNADSAFVNDRKECALAYAVQVEAPVDLYTSGGKEPVFSTDEAPDEPVPSTVPTGKQVTP